MRTYCAQLLIIVVCLGVSSTGGATNSGAMQSVGRPDRSCFFTENKGQWDERVLFKADGAGGLTWYIERDGFTVLFGVPDTTAEPIADPRSIGLPDEMRRFDTVDRYPNKAHALKFKFQNVLPRTAGNFLPEQSSPATASSIETAERLSWNNNYFLGNDESRWAPDCGNYRRVVLKDVWKGVDVQWRGVGQAVEFDFVVAPGADVSQIRVECLGLTGDLEATADSGELLLPTSLGVLRQALPEAYQIEKDGSLQEVKAEFKVEGGNSFGVALPEGHDADKPLIVDPLIYSTYLGAGSTDYAYTLSPDGAGGVLVAGSTRSNDFPTTEGAYQRNIGGNDDAFIAGLNAEGSALVYSTYLGGSNNDWARALFPDGAGGVLVAGYTSSNDFATTEGAYQRNFGGGYDAFIARLNSEGNALIYSTYLGESRDDVAYSLSPDSAGGVFVAGYTYSNDFPTTDGAYQRDFGGGNDDAFIAHLNGEGSALIYSTYLGGSGSDRASSLSPDGAGGVLVAGWTRSNDFPTTEGTYQRNIGGNYDAFIARLNAEGSDLRYSTYLGGSGYDEATALSPDGAGGVVVAGYTDSNDIPTTEGAYQRNYGGGGYDAFIARLNAEGSALIYCTYLGGSSFDVAYALTSDGAGGVIVAGTTYSSDFPTTEGAYQRNFGGNDDAFIGRLNADGSALIYSTYLGGRNYDNAYALSPDGAGGVVVAGYTYSNDFPTTEGAFDESYNGGDYDAFITDIDIGLTLPGMLFGHVYDLADGTPLSEALVLTSRSDSVVTDEDGHWHFDQISSGVFILTASKTGYNDSTLTDFEIAPEDTLEVDFSLLHPTFDISDDHLGSVVPTDASIDVPFNISNRGNGPLIWSAEKRLLGDANAELGELRRSCSATDSTGDDRIEGVIFTQERFFISGSGGDQPSRIYVLDRDGSLLSSFPQFGDSRYGYKDLEWDGELIWGSGDDSVFAESPDGQLFSQWRAPFAPTNNIACDPDRGLLYLAGTTSNIATYDLDGNAVGAQLNRHGFRIYGLSYWRDDPDGYPLYILNVPAGNQPLIHKMNPETGDTMFVAELPVPEGQTLTGLSISSDYDLYSTVMLTILNAPPADGGDCIYAYQLCADKSWFGIDVVEGELPAGNSQDLVLMLDATALPDTTFEGELHFTHNAEGGEAVCSVRLTVTDIPLVSFSLISPADGDTLVALPLHGEVVMFPPVEFVWQSVLVDSVTYRLEFRLPDTLISLQVADTTIRLDLDTLGLRLWFDTQLEWNVIAMLGEEAVPCQEPFHLVLMPNATGETPVQMPVEFGLCAPFPNPFNNTVRLTYGLPEAGRVQLSVFDISGREVVNLVNGSKIAGVHSIIWEAGNMPNGIYFARLNCAEKAQTVKLMLVK